MRFKIHSNFRQTGGPDCLHQLCAAVTHRGYYGAMIYPPVGYGLGVFKLYSDKYNIHNAEMREDNLDDPDTVQVIPANWGADWYPTDPNYPSCISIRGDNPYKSIKIMWWLGVTTWQNWANGGREAEVDLGHPCLQNMYHACQSQMAFDFLMSSNKINPEKIFLLRDYTSQLFIHDEQQLEKTINYRENLILYNPVKGMNVTNQIMNTCMGMDCTFIPIANMTHEQMRDLGLKAKIYIDFGNFPGRDKIHRELASCGCIIITGNEGAAANPIDVPNGPRKFYKTAGHYDLIAIRKQIKKDLSNYFDALYDDHMINYRTVVRLEKQTFEHDVENMLQLLSASNCG